MNKECLDRLRVRTAKTSVGPATARGMAPGKSGFVKEAQNFLMAPDLLTKFNKKSEAKFKLTLDIVTADFEKCLNNFYFGSDEAPEGKRRFWGPARKFLNIFLRGCAYNKYLCAKFNLETIEPWLEIPLDSHVFKGLKSSKEASNASLPGWKRVIRLTEEKSEIYQNFAKKIAQDKKINPVDLDLLYWRAETEES